MQTLFILYHAVAIFSCLYVIVDIAARLVKRNTLYHDDLMNFKRFMEKILEENKHKDPHTECPTASLILKIKSHLENVTHPHYKRDPDIMRVEATHIANYAFMLYHRNRKDICTCTTNRICTACELEEKARARKIGETLWPK